MPSTGITIRRIPSDLPAAGAAVVRLHASAYMTPEQIEELRKRYTREADFQKEINIVYEALEGELYYPEYNPAYVDCDPFDVSDPDDWTIYMACDPHMRTPHAFLWKAWNREGESVVCGELWPDRQYSVSEYGETIKWIESDSHEKPAMWDWARGKKLRILKRYMDTHGTAANSDEGVNFFFAYKNHGLTFYSAFKSAQALAAARDKIGKSMLPEKVVIGDAVRWTPRHRIFRQCRELRSEYANARYPSGEIERASQEKPKTYRKHLIDCAHYIETAHPCFVEPVIASKQNTFVPMYPALGY